MNARDPRTYVSARETTGSFGRFQLRPSHLKTQIAPADQMHGTYVTSLATVDPAIARAAALQVCAHAADAVDANRLLDALGLGPVLRGAA